MTLHAAATGELRERVRERLVLTELELSRALAGASPRGEDEIVALLLRGEPDAVRAATRPARQTRSPNFDAATIETTHGFCQKVLDELGTLGDLEPDVTFVENVDDLVDGGRRRPLRAALPSRRRGPDQPRGGAARSPGSRSTTRPRRCTRCRPRDRPATARCAAGWRWPRARSSSGASARLALMTFDDQLTRLRDDARRRRTAPAAIAKLRARYRVVLIDEFQDTDPTQWEIVERAFAGGEVPLVLIADPKQAIYAFRGADVYAYLRAARSGRRDVDARASTTAATSCCSTASTRCSAPPGSATRRSSTGASPRRRPTGARDCMERPVHRRCGSASSTAATRRSSGPRAGLGVARLGARPHRPRRRGRRRRAAVGRRPDRAALAERRDGGGAHVAPGRRRRAGADPQDRRRWSTASCSRARCPGGDQRRRQRVRDRRRAPTGERCCRRSSDPPPRRAPAPPR